MLAGKRVASPDAAHHSSKKVALLIETDRAYGRGILHGISRWVQRHGDWSLYIEPGSLKQALPKLHAWGCDGVIARIATRAIDEAIRRLNLPAVVMSYEAAPHQGRLGTQSQKEGGLAVEYFLDRGFRNFAFCGHPEQFSIERFQGFADRLAREGLRVHEYRRRWSHRDRWWVGEQEHMAHWLAGLPKPIALFAATDDIGRRVLEACHWQGLHVPDEIAVLGVDNDELLCELCTPPLSSIALNTEKAGFEAAALLDAMMAGLNPSRKMIVVEPLGVVSRQSTDVLAVEDRDVAMAIRYIREHSHEPITVSDILRAIPVSRRSLECRFKRILGRTLHEEVMHARLDRAKQLLATSDMPMPQVAKASGFSSADYMGYVFRKAEGQAPLSFRKRSRAGE